MKASILVNGADRIKAVVNKLSGISGLSDISVISDSMVSFIYHSEEAALRVFEEFAGGDLLRKENS